MVLGSEKWLYLGCILAIAPTGIWFGSQVWQKENSDDFSWVNGIKAKVFRNANQVFSDLARLPHWVSLLPFPSHPLPFLPQLAFFFILQICQAYPNSKALPMLFPLPKTRFFAIFMWFVCFFISCRSPITWLVYKIITTNILPNPQEFLSPLLFDYCFS